ncbi:hypothetical protein L1887_29487 [Cichorium endivia]|nr:hypothetical protein L1887_29487 [Cichorium endivia]
MCKIPFVIWLLFSQWKEYLVYFLLFFFLEFLICGWELNIHSCLLSFQRMMFSLVAGVFYDEFMTKVALILLYLFCDVMPLV